MRRLLSALSTATLAVATWLPAGPALALSASPMILEMQSAGTRARASLTIVNPSSDTVALDLETLTLSMDGAGRPSYEPDDANLLVFPPIVSLAPGASQVVRVQYIGDPELAASRSFRLSVLQVPVTLDGAQVSLKVATQLHALVNVAPPGATPSLEVVSIEPGAVGRWVVGIRNDGDRHARLEETRWSVEAGGRAVELRGAELANAVEGSLVLPGSTRTVTLTPPPGMDAADARIRIRTAL